MQINLSNAKRIKTWNFVLAFILDPHMQIRFSNENFTIIIETHISLESDCK